MIKLVAIDLDDTLINNELEITSENLEAVAAVREKGVEVAIATGRMYKSTLPFAKKLGLPHDQALICYNGAMIKRFNGELIAHTAVERQTTIDIIKYCQARGWTLNIYRDDQLYVSQLDDNVEYYMQMVGVEAQPVGNLLDFVTDGNLELSKMLIIGSEDQIQSNLGAVQEKFAGVAQVTCSKKRYIEITHFNASKAKALSYYATNKGLDASQIMAIGDGGNDLEMVKWAGLGVAVANANPEVRRAADFVTKSNVESGVAFALRKFI